MKSQRDADHLVTVPRILEISRLGSELPALVVAAAAIEALASVELMKSGLTSMNASCRRH